MGTGNTSDFSYTHTGMAVHPRGHGEHQMPDGNLIREVGSSPWARGTQIVTMAEIVKYRFIPVGTGNTRSEKPGGSRKPVHPRGHGEHRCT